MGCASSAPFNPGAVANDAPIDANGGGGGLAAKLRRNAGDIVDTTTSSVMGEAERLKDGAVAKMQDMGETIQETAEEAVDKVTDKLTSTFKDLTSAAEEKAAEAEEGAAEAEAAIAEAKARAEEDIENEVRNMVEDLEQELPPPDMPPPDSEKPATDSQHLQETSEGDQPQGVIITELASDEQPPDTSEVNLGFVEVPDGELLGTPRDTLEREIEGSPPPSALPESHIQPQAVPYPFVNLTEMNFDEATSDQQNGEESEETQDETRAESPAYEEINVESSNDNASISELNNNEPIKDGEAATNEDEAATNEDEAATNEDEAATNEDDATPETNNMETGDDENTPSPPQDEQPTEEEPANNDNAEQKDENDEEKEEDGEEKKDDEEKEEDGEEKKDEEDDGAEKDVEDR